MWSAYLLVFSVVLLYLLWEYTSFKLYECEQEIREWFRKYHELYD